MKRRSIRRRNKSSNTETDEAQRAPYITRRLSTFNVLSEDGLAQIEANADQILFETGMEFQDDPEILTIFATAGCDVQ